MSKKSNIGNTGEYGKILSFASRNTNSTKSIFTPNKEPENNKGELIELFQFGETKAKYFDLEPDFEHIKKYPIGLQRVLALSRLLISNPDLSSLDVQPLNDESSDRETKQILNSLIRQNLWNDDSPIKKQISEIASTGTLDGLVKNPSTQEADVVSIHKMLKLNKLFGQISGGDSLNWKFEYPLRTDDSGDTKTYSVVSKEIKIDDEWVKFFLIVDANKNLPKKEVVEIKPIEKKIISPKFKVGQKVSLTKEETIFKKTPGVNKVVNFVKQIPEKKSKTSDVWEDFKIHTKIMCSALVSGGPNSQQRALEYLRYRKIPENLAIMMTDPKFFTDFFKVLESSELTVLNSLVEEVDPRENFGQDQTVRYEVIVRPNISNDTEINPDVIDLLQGLYFLVDEEFLII